MPVSDQNIFLKYPYLTFFIHHLVAAPPACHTIIFSHLNYCYLIWGKCSEKLQHEVQKCINFAAKVASNRKYLKRDHVTPLLRDLKWINFNSILWLNEVSFMYKNLYVSADSNVKKINFDPRNKVSQRITKNSSNLHIDYRRTAVGQKAVSVSVQSCGIRSRWISEIKIPSLCSKVICTNTS